MPEAGTWWQVLFVDDENDFCKSVREELEGEEINGGGRLHIKTMTNFDDTLAELEARRYDVLVLDVMLGDAGKVLEKDKGREVLDLIKQRRFIPVVFYTALPELVRDIEAQERPLVQVVEKTTAFEPVLEAIREILATGIPAINRALIHHLETVQRDYMWDFVAKHWEQYGEQSDYTALAYLMASRLAVSLSGPGIQKLAEDLGGPVGKAIRDGMAHPLQYYILPPVQGSSPRAGDLYRGKIGEQSGYWILLTPSCDMVHNKAEKALLALCEPLEEYPEFIAYKKSCESSEKPSNGTAGKLRSLLTNNRQKKGRQPERYYCLPGALSVPGLVVDFQQLVTLPRGELDTDTLERIASLDSPFAEALISRFTRYFGRLGTPDLDTDYVLSQISSRVTGRSG